ncbi:hypothetical protein [Spirosoma sp.]|uniref:hypothetical protein n=1 Tax=Spirosoma sp. TaxID=1899569 RepID=UPI003B3BBF1F
MGSNDARGVFATSTKIYVASVGPLFGEPVGGISFCSTTCSTTVSISAAPSLTVSQGQSATLTAAGATSYQWSTGATTESIEVSQAGIYSVTGTTGACSATASASLSVLPGADLTPVVYLRPFNLYGTSAVSVVVSVYELNGVAASGPITVKLSKDPKFSLSLPSMESSVGGVPVQNSQWTLAPPETDPDYYVLTTNAVLSGGGELSFGLTGNFTSGSTSGQAILTAVVEPQSGEANVSNNVDSERASYFQK